MLNIDGSMGEGGGQVLRTAIALSLCLGRPFRIFNIRSGRKKPGLRRQHLVAVRAAGELSNARVEGAEIGSGELTFVPGGVAAGKYRFAIESAGSTSLVLQTVLPALLTAGGSSHLILEGGTHNPFAPSFDFVNLAFLPLINRMGPKVSAKLSRPGFYPGGEGLVHIHIEPVDALMPIHLSERGEILDRRAFAMVANLPEHIAHRELKVIGAELGLAPDNTEVRQVEATGPGNALLVVVKSRWVTEVFTGFGQRGIRAEEVAARVGRNVRRYLVAGVPVGEHLADQLLLPLALAGGGSYRTLRPSLHTETNIAVLRKFLGIAIQCKKIQEDCWDIALG